MQVVSSRPRIKARTELKTELYVASHSPGLKISKLDRVRTLWFLNCIEAHQCVVASATTHYLGFYTAKKPRLHNRTNTLS